MPHRLNPAIVVVTCLLILAGAYSVVAGPLNPPVGPIAPTQKPLADVEPRTVIRQADIPLTIDAQGSYLLGEDIEPQGGSQTAIIILADNMTLDLGGFSIQQNNDTLQSFTQGVFVSNIAQDVTIKNGTVRGSQTNGITAVAGSRVRLRDVNASNNGGAGFSLQDNAVLIGCTASDNLSFGFSVQMHCILNDCNSLSNGSFGFDVGNGSVLEHCVSNEDNGFGIVSEEGCTLNGCTASNTIGTPGNGFFIGNFSTANACSSRLNDSAGYLSGTGGGQLFHSCSASDNGSTGISAGPGSTLNGCSARNNGFAGINAGNGSTLNMCTASFSGNDGFITGVGCSLTGCVARDNGQNSSTSDGFDLGESNRAIDCVSSDNADDGFDVGQSSLRGCVAHSNDGHGFFLNAIGISVSDCTASENSENGFHVSSNGDYFNIAGCLARSNTGDGFTITTGAIFGRLVQCQTSADSYDLGASANFVGEVQNSVGVSNPMSDDPWANVDG